MARGDGLGLVDDAAKFGRANAAPIAITADAREREKRFIAYDGSTKRIWAIGRDILTRRCGEIKAFAAGAPCHLAMLRKDVGSWTKWHNLTDSARRSSRGWGEMTERTAT